MIALFLWFDLNYHLETLTLLKAIKFLFSNFEIPRFCQHTIVFENYCLFFNLFSERPYTKTKVSSFGLSFRYFLLINHNKKLILYKFVKFVPFMILIYLNILHLLFYNRQYAWVFTFAGPNLLFSNRTNNEEWSNVNDGSNLKYSKDDYILILLRVDPTKYWMSC